MLRRYVRADGRVDYAGLHANLAALNRFVNELAAVSPDSNPELFPTREAKLAYWINAYNALVLHAFATDYPAKRDRLAGKLGQFSFFYRRKFKVGGVERSLDDIESRSIRSVGDPRIHFSIVCASESCPWLSPEAYTPENLERKLEAETGRFLAQDRNVKLSSDGAKVELSMIFSWFAKDFGGESGVRRFLGKYRPADASALAKARFAYFKYDWRLNDAAR